jgi:hypothetical protein
MNLDHALALAQIISLGFVAPVAVFRVWRKLDERLTEQDKRLVRIEYQLYENGGLSMKDQMNRACADINELKINQAVIKTRINA